MASARLGPPASFGSSSRKPSSLDVARRNATTSGCGRITSATSSSASPISDVTLWGTDSVSVSAAFFSPSHSCSWSLSHQVASIPAMITWMAPRIEQDPLELLDVLQDEVEQRRPGHRPRCRAAGRRGTPRCARSAR